jgi:hypothetical protein
VAARTPQHVVAAANAATAQSLALLTQFVLHPA